MPFLENYLLMSCTRLALWRVTEQAEALATALDFTDSEREAFAIQHPRNRAAWLAGRSLLRVADPQQVLMAEKNELGKPYLLNDSRDISMSHTEGWAAVSLSQRQTGVDIQVFSDKLLRIRDKFMRSDELPALSPELYAAHVHLFWSAKEALYKAYALREIDFREQLHLAHHQFNPEGGQLLGFVHKAGVSQVYRLVYGFMEDAIWVVAEALR